MNNLPLVLEELIYDYKYQLETAEKYKKVMCNVKNIKYRITGKDRMLRSKRIISGRKVEHYYPYGIKNFLLSESFSKSSYQTIYIECGYNLRERRYTHKTRVTNY